MVVGVSDFALEVNSGRRTTGNPTALPQGSALRIRNKLNIFKGVRLPFCAPRLILGHFFIAQHFFWAGAKGCGRGSRERRDRIRTLFPPALASVGGTK